MQNMKPIIFSTAMVQAILAGDKTQTRRVIKPQPCAEATAFHKFIHSEDCGWEARFSNSHSNAVCDRKVRIDNGDILYVRETWAHSKEPSENDTGQDHEGYLYKATDTTNGKYSTVKWKPSIHMPKAAARLFLRVTNVRVEQLQDISINDCCREGYDTKFYSKFDGARDWFFHLWNSINAERGYPWSSNPWVWVYEFERITETEAGLC
ncbi:MAG: hypothetical protein FWB96_01350 [Defluviitaleaceae bacterium]|nr:hypothetical protein [Defluviitaleaceae bacterium]MCL2261661.1 hypothetical protein [Defluviitaleaceae bacterium]